MSENLIKAEVYLTGIALSDKSKADIIFDSVDPDLFSFDDVKRLFIKARDHWKRTGSLDYNTFSMFLSSDEESVAEFVRGYYAPSLDPNELVQAFLDETSVNRTKELATRLAKVEKADEIADYIGELQKIIKGITPMKSMTFAEYMDNFAYSKTQPIHYIETGYPCLDRDVLIDRGDFVILTGEQSAGKTAFSISLAINFALQGYRVAYFSLETSAEGILDRATAIYSGAKMGNIFRHELSDDDMTKVGNKMEDLSALPISVFEAAGSSVETIKRKALECNAEIIFIDYVGLVKGRGSSVYEVSTAVSLDLHTLAQAEGITIVALAQKNRESNKANDGGMHSVSGSGQFESDADLMLNITRQGDRIGADKWRIKLNVSKNKKGRVNSYDMWFHGETQRFTELTDAEIAEERRPVKVYHDVLKH